MSKMSLSQELAWRGFVNQTTLTNIDELDEKKLRFYWGVDPSAVSMTIGNLAAAMMVKVFIKYGYTPYLLVGGATGLIGDPDGKAQERDLKTKEEVDKNKQAIIEQYKKIFNGVDFKVVDNYDWFKDFNYLEFLRDVGKYVPMRQMLAREFVQSRLGEGGSGISYAEFSYSLIQGYDFLHLFEKENVTLQISGADQWGNCITGVDLIRRKTGKEAHVWTTPLIVNKSTGVKFGKSEDGAVWLDAEMTSPNDFYQFWINADDEGCEDYLKIYTELSEEEIATVIKQHELNPSDRIAQRKLAFEVTALIHGAAEAAEAETYVDILKGKELLQNIGVVQEDHLKKNNALVQCTPSQGLVDILVSANLVTSKSEARRLIEANAVSINGHKISTDSLPVELFMDNSSLGYKVALLRKGKKLKDSVVLKLG